MSDDANDKRISTADLRSAGKVAAFLAATVAAIAIITAPAIGIYDRLQLLEAERLRSVEARTINDERLSTLETLATTIRTEMAELRVDVRWMRDAMTRQRNR